MNKIVYDLTEWIPPGGEDNFSFRRRASGDVEVSVRYERDDSPHEIRLVFADVFCFINQPFPGLDIVKDKVGIEGVGILELGVLEESDLGTRCKESSRQYSSATNIPDYRNYFIYSYELGELFHVVAESVTIEHAEPS